MSDLKKVCEDQYKKNIVRDTSIWSVRDITVQRADNVLQSLGFIPPQDLDL